MTEIILTKGLPASGKSTWAKKYVEEHPHTCVITKDDLRKANPRMKEKEIIKLRNKITHENLECFMDVIWADTNFNPIHEETASKIAKEYGGGGVTIADFTQVSPYECIKRDLARPEGRVGSGVIWEMWWKNIVPQEAPEKDLYLNTAIICDIDGTLSKMCKRSPFDWSRVGEDEVVPEIATMVKLYSEAGFKIILVSGRDSICREQTIAWLVENNIPFDSLFMRQEKDMRSDTIVKEEIYHTCIEGNYNIEFVLDDRPKVIRMWRQLGLKVLNVQGHTDYEF